MLNDLVEIKSTSFTPFMAYLKTSDPETIKATLQEKIVKAPTLFLNAPLILNISALSDESLDFVAIKQAITQIGMFVIGVCGCHDEQQKIAALQAHLALVNPSKQLKQIILPNGDFTHKATMIVDKPVRAGQQIYAHDSDLIITSYVNAGAEVIADGNIHIYGTLRGRALAGANNNQHAQIFCTHLLAELISIAGQYWLSDQIPDEFSNKAVNLKIQHGQLAITYLK